MENDSENNSLCGFEEPREEDQSLYGYMELSQEEADVRKTLLECIEIQVTGKFATGHNLQSLVKALSLWEYMHNPPNYLIYPLNNQYITENLRLSSLEGPDSDRVHRLNDSCNQHGKFHLFLAQLYNCNIWPNEDDEDDELDIHCQKYLHNVCSLEGFKLSTQKVNVDKVLPLKSISCERDPDTRIGRQNLGSQGRRIESNAVLLIVRTDFLHAPLFKSRDPQEVDRVMTHLRAGINDNNKATVQKIISCLCRIILNEGFAAGEANDKYLGYVAATAAYLGDRSLLEEACNKTLMTSEWDKNTWVTLGAQIDPLRDPEAHTIFKSLRKYGTFCIIYRALTNFHNGLYKHNSPETPWKAEFWKQWYIKKLTQTLNLCNALEGPEAVDVIDEIDKIILDPEIQYKPEQRKEIDEAVIGLIDRFKDAKDFIFALNVNLLRHLTNRRDVRRQEVLHDLFNVILKSAISTFYFDSYHNRRILHIFYREALAHDKGSASQLLQQILKNLCRTDKSTALRILILLIRELVSLEDTSSLEVQSQLLLNAYINKAAGVKPSKPGSWARPMEVQICPLKCKACNELNFFLNDPKEEEITMDLDPWQQKHIEEIYIYLEIENGDREDEVRLTKTLIRWNNSYRNWKSRAKAAKDDLKKTFGNRYNRLTGSTAQAANKAQLPKLKRGEDTDNSSARTSKRARGDGEKKESG